VLIPIIPPPRQIMTLLKTKFLLIALFLLVACPWQEAARAAGQEKLLVFTSLEPVSFVAAQIGGHQVSVHTLIPPGRDPHTFSPNPRQMVALSQADIYFTIAMTFEEELLHRLAVEETDLRVVDCSAGIARRHLKEHQHDTGQGDPHIWLGINPLAQMARNISAALSQEAPANQGQFAENLDHFLGRLTRLEEELSSQLAPFKGRSFLVFHPSFGYFADSFGLVQEAVEIEGKSPSPRQLAALTRMARAKDIRAIFIQPQFDKRAAQRIAQAIDGEVLTMDPLAADVFANLQAMAEKIAAGLGK
jgi:zinc transport system substrate-binding protein